MTTSNSAARTSARAEGIAQITIMFAIGVAAGAASFTHVHNVAAAHGQAGWLAWADAIVLEMMSIASGLELRRRKRHRAPLRFPALVLVVATALSISAQVVEAERSIIGWIAAALPALGFLVMVKIALSRSHPRTMTAPLVDHISVEQPTQDADLLAELVEARRREFRPVAVLDETPSPLGQRAAAALARPAARPRRRTVPIAPGREHLDRRGDVKVPATAAAVMQWVATWVHMCADGTTVHGPLNDDRYARDRYQLSAKQLRNVRNAATCGALRRKAGELGVPLPTGYTDNPVVHDETLAAA